MQAITLRYPAAPAAPTAIFQRALLLTLSLAAALLTFGTHAQTADTAAALAAASQPASAPAAPKYSEKDIQRAFNFMDKNGDGKISREEAAGFRGVAKHFDEADTDKDNALSLKEFERAMNGPKP